ncbi:MAG: glycosyltransferase N-terminal domain-containing protein [Bacteroidota bacterium]
MLLVYNFTISLYYLAIKLASISNQKAKDWINGRKNIFSKIDEKIQGNEKIIWIHTASLGEFEQGRPLLEKLKKLNPDIKILLTFYSPSGYNVRRNFEYADFIFYLPLDTKRNAGKFIEIVNPSKVFFVKYEFWYHYLNQLKIRNIPVYLISANFRPDQLFFRWYGKWYRQMLLFFSHIFVQNTESANILKSHNITNVSVSGDTRFDRVYSITQNSTDFPEIKLFSENAKVLIFGSTWKKDEELLIKFININKNRLEIKYIVAPHEINKENIKLFQKQINVSSICHSELTINAEKNYQCLIIDSIGKLSSVYKYGYVAYVGGGFGKGIHNILEPAAFSLPVIFGPKHEKFNEAIELINQKGAFSIDDFEKFEIILNRFINDSDFYSSTQKNVTQFVVNNLGAVERILNSIFQFQSK